MNPKFVLGLLVIALPLLIAIDELGRPARLPNAVLREFLRHPFLDEQASIERKAFLLAGPGGSVHYERVLDGTHFRNPEYYTIKITIKPAPTRQDGRAEIVLKYLWIPRSRTAEVKSIELGGHEITVLAARKRLKALEVQ